MCESGIRFVNGTIRAEPRQPPKRHWGDEW